MSLCAAFEANEHRPETQRRMDDYRSNFRGLVNKCQTFDLHKQALN